MSNEKKAIEMVKEFVKVQYGSSRPSVKIGYAYPEGDQFDMLFKFRSYLIEFRVDVKNEIVYSACGDVVYEKGKIFKMW